MKAGSMEALIGANQSMKMVDKPMRVYKEAERKGDDATMERAMGYVQDFEKKADNYSDKAREEISKELKEERKEQEILREQAIEKRKEEARAYEEAMQENPDVQTDFVDRVELSREGSAVLKMQAISGEPTATLKNTDVKRYDSEGKPVVTKPLAVSVDEKVGG